MSDDKKATRIQDLEAVITSLLTIHTEYDHILDIERCIHCGAMAKAVIEIEHKDACPVRIAHKALNKDS